MSGRRTRVRRLLPLALLAAGVLAVVLLTGPGGDGPPLDPASAGPGGTKALIDVLGELGTDVRVASEVQASDTAALLLADDLDDTARATLQDWVEEGGTLVVTDPGSPLSPPVAGPAGIGPLETSIPRRCSLPVLEDVERVATPGGAVYTTPAPGTPDTTACFPRGEGHWLIATAVGRGAVVALGGAGVFTNAALGDADNGVLAAALLATGDEPVVVLEPPVPGEGRAGLSDLVPLPVRLTVLQLGLAFAVVVAWRARRLGRPVSEPQPVQVPGSELVTAVGNLLQHTSARGQAARLLRAELRRELAERLGLPADSGADAIAGAAARRTGRPAAELTALLDGPDPADEAGLVALASRLEATRRSALAVGSGAKEDLRVS